MSGTAPDISSSAVVPSSAPVSVVASRVNLSDKNNNVQPRLHHVPVCSQAPLGQDCCCCKRCEIGGCDLKVMDCGCCLHARCCPLSPENSQLLQQCPVCGQPTRALKLIPMNSLELDHARQEAAATDISQKRGKKRKNATILRLNPELKERLEAQQQHQQQQEVPSDASNAPAAVPVEPISELRTGRWTLEETAYCDKLIQLFQAGLLPIPDGIKLNEFLSRMLKSKPARLSKKMKNASLSRKAYKRTIGYIVDTPLAKEFSQLETDFFASIRCRMERSEIRFHMQKEWRELFSGYCMSIGQALDADAWLTSVEEMDRQTSHARGAARMAKRKAMMGNALRRDRSNPGVFIDPMSAATETRSPPPQPDTDGSLVRSRTRYCQSPFLGKVISYLERHRMPFEHVDAWVPSFLPAGARGTSNNSGDEGAEKPVCRLCFAGCATAESQIPASGELKAVPLTPEETFDLVSFGEYSEKFSFDLGCGLPGRVYSSGIASWEQGIHNAPSTQFERCGGAQQSGIQTCLGVPIPSPNVGRVVVLFYSRHDRPRDEEVVRRITLELSRLLPSPQWKLVVDIGVTPLTRMTNSNDEKLRQAGELVALLRAYMPEDKAAPLAEYLPGFTSLHLLLMKMTKSPHETELVDSVLDLFSTYKEDHTDRDIAWMTARDYMVLSRHAPDQSLPRSISDGPTFAMSSSAAPQVLPRDNARNGVTTGCSGSNCFGANTGLPCSNRPQENPPTAVSRLPPGTHPGTPLGSGLKGA